jgi:hypothetical protein
MLSVTAMLLVSGGSIPSLSGISGLGSRLMMAALSHADQAMSPT